MSNVPNFYGDAKCDLIDFLGEKYDHIVPYDHPPKKLVGFLCKLFEIERNEYTGKQKSKAILATFLNSKEFTRESFGHAYEMMTRGVDQKDVMRAKQVLGIEQYNELLGRYHKTIEHSDIPVIANSKIFYNTPEWKRARYQALRIYKNFCQCCGRKRSEKLELHVDHIIPKSIRPELALELSNLQILCADCNQGKDNIDATDWRDEKSTIK